MIYTPLIRPYTPADKETVLELIRLNTPTFFAPEEEEELVYYLDNEIEQYFILELDNQIVGSGGFNYSKNPKVAYLSWDIIHPDFQGKTLGSQLLEYRMEQLKKDKKIQIITVRTSQFVYPFYKKHNFRLEEVVEDYWAEGYDLYGMGFVL